MHISFFEQKLQRLNVIILFVSTIYTYKQYVIRYKRCKLFIIHSSYQRTILLAKRKRYNSTLNLTLMTVIIYTGNKVKSNRGEEKKKGFN